MKLPLASLLCLLTAGAVPAFAQQVVFHDGFENGLSNWTATGMWNLEDSSDPCGSQAGPFVEGTKAAWYGTEGQCNFNTGNQANQGTLALNNWIALPFEESVNLRFWSWCHTEACWGQWDVHTVTIEATGGPNGGFTQQLCPSNGPESLLLPWHERRIDLSAYRGTSVRVTFSFWTGDAGFNTWLGWLVDDVTIIAEPGQKVCPPDLNSGCPCQFSWIPIAGGCRNSTGQSATLLSEGSASVTQDTIRFTAAHLPPGTVPTLFQGTTQATAAVFGDGLRCVGGAQLRLGTHGAPSGATSWPEPGALSISAQGLVPPVGGARYYQVIYRNAGNFCTPATFNLTEAERIVWWP